MATTLGAAATDPVSGRECSRAESAATAPTSGGDGRGSLGSAGLAVSGLLGATRAELGKLQPVRVVAAVLLRDVVAVLAVHARHRDLGTDVGALASHGVNLLSELKKGLNWAVLRKKTGGRRLARGDAPEYATSGANPK